MREIRFKGKRKDNGKWVYGWYAKDFEGEDYILVKFSPVMECYKVDPETVGQSSGLKDRNGREIYEGDVLRIVLGDYVHVFVATSVEDVCYLKNISRFVEYSGYETDGIEVIGNIYESPELLKGEGTA